jgi:hypothetical protein
LVLAVANLAAGFAGGLVTVLAFFAGVVTMGLALEMWYVSRRIDRTQNFAKPS